MTGDRILIDNVSGGKVHGGKGKAPSRGNSAGAESNSEHASLDPFLQVS